MDDNKKITGGCLCEDLRNEGKGEPSWVVHCHCRSCQRASGAAFLTYVGFAIEDLVWSEGKLRIYESSSDGERGFCSRCGSTLTFARPLRKEIGVFAGTVDDPQSITPTEHMFFDHHFAWLDMRDESPRYGRHPPGNEDRDQE